MRFAFRQIILHEHDRHRLEGQLVEETHHTSKKDTPSGTAIKIQSDLNTSFQNYTSGEFQVNDRYYTTTGELMSYNSPDAPQIQLIPGKDIIDQYEVKYEGGFDAGKAAASILGSKAADLIGGGLRNFSSSNKIGSNFSRLFTFS